MCCRLSWQPHQPQRAPPHLASRCTQQLPRRPSTSHWPTQRLALISCEWRPESMPSRFPKQLPRVVLTTAGPWVWLGIAAVTTHTGWCLALKAGRQPCLEWKLEDWLPSALPLNNQGTLLIHCMPTHSYALPFVTFLTPTAAMFPNSMQNTSLAWSGHRLHPQDASHPDLPCV
jgi:hypothetical protein